MVTPNRVLYVEGGGDGNPSLASECRKAFSKLFEKAGIARKPRVIACGGRRRAYDQFCHALAEGNADVWLLVDAEDLPDPGPDSSPWNHVEKRKGDGWKRPKSARDEQLHFMTVCMETWLIADPDALRKVFGSKLDDRKLPAVAQLEITSKQAIYDALAAATKDTKTGAYGKGSHSFRTLEKVSPDALRKLSWGNRFLVEMGATT